MRRLERANIVARAWASHAPLLATVLAKSGSGETVNILDVHAIGFDGQWTDRIGPAITRIG
jgi:hypothetical protein